MIKKLKYNRFTTALIKTAFRLLCRNVKGFIFIASTGRSGTNTLHLLFSAAQKVYACHEGHPIMNGDTMIKFNNNEEELMSVEFNSRKLLRILWHSIGKDYYVETNHMFIKCFYSEAVSLFGERLKVIAVKRNPMEVALSIYGRGGIPGSEKGNNWNLDPKAPRNVIKVDGLLYEDKRFSHDFYKCLWYTYEIQARIIMFRKNFSKVPVVSIETNDLNDMNAVETMFNQLDIAYDRSKLKGLIGTRANSTPLSERVKLDVDPGLVKDFSKVCELKIRELKS